MLYLGRRENAYIVELPEDESDALLDEIWSYTTTADNSYSHHWQVGDVLMWDNRCTMHRRDEFDADARESGGRLFYWDSAAAFEDVAGRLFAMGYDEVGAYYPIDAQRDAMEDAAANVMPGLRG